MAVISKSTILIDRKYLSTILIDRKYSFNYIDQNNYCIIEVFNRAFLKNNIETRDGCKFDKIVRENLWEFQYAFKSGVNKDSK